MDDEDEKFVCEICGCEVDFLEINNEGLCEDCEEDFGQEDKCWYED